MDKMQMKLYESINRSETVLNLLSEPAEIENIRKQLSTLRKAEKILKQTKILLFKQFQLKMKIVRLKAKRAEVGLQKKGRQR
ncbi:unnamed protein product [Blepharisma stoltei]|uniref:Ribosomal protein L29 n=1 Tax=Blepharisma stoltei TaxID=1481888 RepID=A0AAU9K2M7_9CILI|nr:unnamed protein product [Blepharisma stoltei]